jgi:hypothetical protein
MIHLNFCSKTHLNYFYLEKMYCFCLEMNYFLKVLKSNRFHLKNCEKVNLLNRHLSFLSDEKALYLACLSFLMDEKALCLACLSFLTDEKVSYLAYEKA